MSYAIFLPSVPATWQKCFLFMVLTHSSTQKRNFLSFVSGSKLQRISSNAIFGAKRKVNPRDRYKAKEGKSTLANRSSGYARNQKNNKAMKICRLHGQQQSHETGACKVVLDQANKMKAAWKTQPQQYQKKCYNTTYNKRTCFQKNSGEHDNKK
jgi:hypothetical protein